VSSELNAFLNLLYGSDSGYVYVPTKESQTGEWTQTFFQYPKQKDELVSYVERQGKILDVYISPVLWRSPVLHKSQFKQANVAWTEFDGNALTAEETIYEPSMRVQSSDINNQHVYYRLDKPVTEPLEIEKINRIITYSNNADPSAWDLTQILRPPGTKNFKYEATPEVRVIYQGSEILARSLFKDLKEPKKVVTDIKDIPDVLVAIAKYTWPHDDIEFFLKQDIPAGSRSSAMMRLGHVCAELGMTPEDAYAVLRDADDRWGKYKNRSDRHDRLVEIINKAFVTKPPKISKMEIMTMGELLNAEYDDQDWLIERILMPNSISVIYSQPGMGKTRFSFDLATRLATGAENYVGWKLKQSKVLFLSLEMNGPELQRFAKDMPVVVEDDNLILYTEGAPLDMDRATGQEIVYNLMRNYRPDVLMIDSLGASVSADVSNNVEVKQFFRFMNLLRREFNVAVWLIHHGRKATNENKAPISLSDLYGSVYIGAEATTVFCMTAVNNGQSNMLHPVKARFLVDKTPNHIAPDGAGFKHRAEVDRKEEPGNGDPLLPGLGL
jgi:KaiC/GvpD/RAD55 family RecA-like ATPase